MTEEEKLRLHMESALRAHALNSEEIARSFDATIQHGLEAIRTAALINGGAVIVVFAFLGAIYNADAEDVRQLRESLLSSAWIFVLGAMLSGVASGSAYFAQAQFTLGSGSKRRSWDWPYVHSTEASKRHNGWGSFWQAIAVAFVLASYLFLFTGVAAIISSIQ